MIFDTTPKRQMLTFVIAGCVLGGTLAAAAMALPLLAPF